jgi:hypothetical protein
MESVTMNGREMNVTHVEQIDGAIGADMANRGWVPAFFTLTGKRGGCVTCLRSARSGEFSKI